MNKIDAKDTIEKLAERFDYHVESFKRSRYNGNMLQLNKDLQNTTLPEQKEQLQARIKYTDKQIDKLVYQLYELSEDEIKVVEGE